MDSALGRSPQNVDPLSWFTGPLIPLMFGALAVTLGSTLTIVTVSNSPLPALQWLAVAATLSAFIVIAAFAWSRHSEFTTRRASIPLLLGWLAVVLSALGYSGGAMPIEWWWAPIAMALIIAALAPYSSSIRMIVAGSLSSLVTACTVILAFLPSSSIWSPVTFVLIGTVMVVIGTVGSAVFSYQVAHRIIRWSSKKENSGLSSGVLGEAAKLRILHGELVRLSERALPVLRRVAETGVVTAQDRERAAEVAEELRAELVDRANRSWLETIAQSMRLTVIDSEHRADRMTPTQRSALLGLLRAAGDGSVGEDVQLVIELRADPDGSTAVAVSTDVRLPEGRRVMLLAPHYLTLKAAVDDSHWDNHERLRVDFRLPPEA